MSKLERRNQAKQKRLTHHVRHAKATSVFTGKDAAPRIVAVVPLSPGVSAKDAVVQFNKSLEIEDVVPEAGLCRVHVDRYKQTLQYLVLKRELLSALDACRVADYVIFVLSAEEEVDELGECLIRSIESQGLSSTLAVVQGLDRIEQTKKRPQIVASLKSYITHFLPTIDKINSLNTTQENLNVLRMLCTTTPKGIRWREDRSWMMVEEVRWPSANSTSSDEGVSEVIVTGVVRGMGLKADRLLQVGDWGAFQIDKITAAPLPVTRKKTKDSNMPVETDGIGAILETPTEDQDDLAGLAPEEVAMDDVDDVARSLAPSERKGVLLDDHHYFSDEETKEEEDHPKRLPRGTSKYQAAWYLEDDSDSASDVESVDESFWAGNEDEDNDPAIKATEDINMLEPTEAGPSEYPHSDLFLDPAPEDETEAIDAYRKSRRVEEAEDLEFPDEIELHPNVLARERLSRYRGLKSLRTSPWETEEDRAHEPEEWRRLLEVKNYRGARNRVLNEALVGGVGAGTRCSIHLKSVPLVLQQQYDANAPLTAFSLLRHEHKRTVVNYSITLSSDAGAPVKSKEELIVQCGPRRFVVNPLYSAVGSTPNDVHKYHRYLHASRTAIASFIAPLTWGSVPVLYFKRDAAADPAAPPELIGTGTSLPPSQSRVIAKRIILTGHPYKIHRRVVTVRYMFFNAEDVTWFKALPLWTRRGRSGFIKESLGTHGYFKATFDGRINPMDAVAVSLYKRVWPRNARLWRPQEDVARHEMVEHEEMPELVMSG